MPFRSTFQLTATEEAMLRAAGKNPDDYIALPVAVEVDPSRPVDLIRAPTLRGQLPREIIRVPLQAGLDASWFHCQARTGRVYAIQGMMGVLPSRMLLPQANFTPAGVEALAAIVEAERTAWAASAPPAPDAPTG